MRSKDIKWWAAAVLVILLDQIVKFFVAGALSQADSLVVIPHILNFIYVKNTGAAFSMFSGKTVILGFVSVIFCAAVIVIWCLKKKKHFLFELSLMLLFAGAFANAIDRIFRGYVVDFIETAFIRFPVFNIADIAITFGTAFLMVYLIFFDKDKSEKAQPEKSEENE